MAEIDPFYDPEEERRALAQGERNKAMRERMARGKRKLDEIDGETERDMQPSAEYLAIPVEVVKVAPWRRREGTNGLNGFVALHEELVEFVDWLSLSERERGKKEEFLEAVRTTVKSMFAGSECTVFGSWYTGLCLPDSDLDVSISLPEREKDHLRMLADRLLGEVGVEYVEIRDKARIPLLVVRKGDCEMDITFTDRDSSQMEHPRGTSDFIKYKGLRKYPQMRPLILFLKVFLQQRALQDTFTGGMGSYLLSCMVLGFLQQKEMRTGSLQSQGLTLGHLLFDFFTFYTKDLNTSREGLSVVGSGLRFDKRDRKFEVTGKNQTGDALCVESPLEPHIDIGGKCFQWRAVKQAFMQARLVIANQIQARVDPEITNLAPCILTAGLLDPSLFQGKLVNRPEPPAKRRRLNLQREIPVEPRRNHQHSDRRQQHQYSSQRRH